MEVQKVIDAVIIGGGPAGYSCAIRISQLGGKAVLVEKEEMGGVCANCGCIPTKTLQATAKLIGKLEKSGNYGISSNYSLDFGRIMERKEKVIKTSVAGLRSLMRRHGVETVRGTGIIVSGNSVRIEETGKTIEARNIVIATGSKPISIGGVEGHTSEEMLGLKDIPKKLLVIGGGVMGVEFATIFSRLGSEVTIVEMESRLIPAEDEEMSRALMGIMERDGIRVFTSSVVERASEGRALIKTGEKVVEEEFDRILLSVGRRPHVPSELDELGIKYDKNGIKVNEKMRTNIKNIYAVGDVTGGMFLAHVARHEGIVAGENIMGKRSKVSYGGVPVCIFTIPEIASVGSPVKGCRTGKSYFAASGRARTSDETDGFVKVYSKNGRIVSVSIIGECATEMIAEAALAVDRAVPIKDLRKMVWAHPTFSETFMEAIENLGV